MHSGPLGSDACVHLAELHVCTSWTSLLDCVLCLWRQGSCLQLFFFDNVNRFLKHFFAQRVSQRIKKKKKKIALSNERRPVVLNVYRTAIHSGPVGLDVCIGVTMHSDPLRWSECVCLTMCFGIWAKVHVY